MKIIKILMLLFCITSVSFADSLSVERRLQDVERTVKQIDANQLNYRIEKDLLKETYSNSYEKISLVITIVLGVIGVLAYLGLKDISTIKKEYEVELANLREIQKEFSSKSKEIDDDKQKFNDELKSIIKANEEQNQKIKFLEVKDKVRTLFENDQLTPALEFANVGLQIVPNDAELLNTKGRILCRLNELKEATNTYLAALEANGKDTYTILNTVECLYFSNDIERANKIIEQNKNVFDDKDNKWVHNLLKLLALYHADNKDDLRSIAKGLVTYTNLNLKGKKVKDWELEEATHFAYFEPESEKKALLENIIWYWRGEITGKELLTNLKLELPKKPVV